MSYLKVIRASAGSGKTFNLAGEFMVLLFRDPDKFRNILAVTFTNKATEEMKSRIIKEIYNISEGKSSPYLKRIMDETHMQENFIRQRAGYIISVILHDYSRFSVLTIDSFFQRIIRSFTAELGLQTGYSIEIETEPVLTDIVERLFRKLDSDSQLLEWLAGYAETLIEEGENWNFRKGIEKLGKQIFREAFAQLPETSKSELTNRKMILDFRRKTYLTVEKCILEYSEPGKQALSLMKEYNLTPDDFSYKNQGVAGYLAKIAGGNFYAPGPRIREALQGHEKNWYSKNSPGKDIIIEACNSGLLQMLNQAAEYYDTNERLYNTSSEVLKNLYNLGILSDLVANVADYCNENNVFILSEASHFIQRIIADNDTPFIYEKAGQWYNHFMIDEFQDTSMLQWKNFKPLISNSLSQNFGNLLVGDVKQSIYRWRNSDWEILAKGIEQDYIPEVLKFVDLTENRRSAPNIVLFNNEFFRKASSLLQQQFSAESAGNHPSSADETRMNTSSTNNMKNNVMRVPDDLRNKNLSEEITAVYGGLNQVPAVAGNTEGNVTIRVFADDRPVDEYRDFICERLLDEIFTLLSLGYRSSDIAILTRSNSEATRIAGYILDQRNSGPGIPVTLEVISDEALILSASSSVRFLISLIKHMVDPLDKTNNYHILSEYLNYVVRKGESPEFLMPEDEYPAWESSFYEILPDGFLRLVSDEGRSSLTETVAELMILFNLDKNANESVYLHTFQDIVLDFTQRHSSDPLLFLEYWEETGKDKAVTASVSQDAVRILTIHKAKGLEFNIVILPFCNWKIISNGDIMWCKTDTFSESGPDFVPVRFTSNLEKTYFSDYYYEEVKKQYVDNLNLLYVAFTRAKTSLIVYCRDFKNEGDRQSRISDVSKLTVSVISGITETQDNGISGTVAFKVIYNNDNNVFSLGNLSGISAGADDSQPDGGNISGNIVNRPLSNDVLQGGKPAGSIQDRLRISFRNTDLYIDGDSGLYTVPVNTGRMMHELFSNIKTADDIPSAVRKLVLQGLIDEGEMDKFVSVIKGYIKDEKVASWFDDSWKVMTEADIILPGGMTKRPDRVMISGDRAVVVDYKFGSSIQPHYKTQVATYLSLLKRMGYSAEGFIWYVEQGTVIEV